MASEKIDKPLEKPLTTAQVTEMMYRRHRERARLAQEYREKYDPNGPTGTNAPNSNYLGKK